MEFGEVYGLIKTSEWLVLIACGIMVGMSKTGVQGTGLLVVPLMAGVFGGKPSAGLLLPMLIVADVFAVIFYNRHANWKYVLRLMPFTLVGIAIGVITGNLISDSQFMTLIAILVLAGMMLMVFRDWRGKNEKVPDKLHFTASLGLSGGFATMVGNASGPIMSFYLLSMRLPKNSFIGTGAWFFLIINLTKVPLHIIFWKTIHTESLTFNVLMVPAILLGAFIGVRLVMIIPERPYRNFIIFTTILSAGVLLLKASD